MAVKKKKRAPEKGFHSEMLYVFFTYSNITEMKTKETNWTDEVPGKSDWHRVDG